MGVLILPHNCEPRRRASVPLARPYTFVDAQFPPIVAGHNATSQKENSSIGTRTWVEVVQNGAPFVEETILETTVTKPVDTTATEVHTAEASVTTQEFHRFMQLPKELRLPIWHNAIVKEPYIRPDGVSQCYLSVTIDIRDCVNLADDPLDPKFLPGMCTVSKVTREETIAVLIEGSKFMVASIHDNKFLQASLKAMPGRLELCRNLSFDFFSRFPPDYDKNADLELAAQCTGLKTIKLTFHNEPLTYNVLEGDYDEGLSRQARPADLLFERFKLQRLLDCKSLQLLSSRIPATTWLQQ